MKKNSAIRLINFQIYRFIDNIGVFGPGYTYCKLNINLTAQDQYDNLLCFYNDWGNINGHGNCPYVPQPKTSAYNPLIMVITQDG